MEMIQHRTVADRVAEELLRFLSSGRCGVGDRLPTEPQLMEMLGVGRSSVREGVQRLVSLGLVSVRPSKGAVVINLPFSVLSPDLGPMGSLLRKRVDDLQAARQVLELAVIDSVVKLATPQDFDALQAVVDDIRQRLDQGKSVADPAAEFHVVLARAGGNWIMPRMVESVVNIMREHGGFVGSLPGWPEQEYVLHQQLLAVLRTRDPLASRKEMIRHLDVSFGALRKALSVADPEQVSGDDVAQAI